MKLKDICEKIGSGATPKGGKGAYTTQGISLIRSQNVLDFSFAYDGLAYINEQQAEKLNNVTIEKGDVLLNITGDSVARVCMVPDEVLPARVNQHVSIIRGKAECVLGSYLLYYLQMLKPVLLQLASGGATRNALTKGMLEELEIEVPTISEQKKIVSIIDDIQEKIKNNTKINDNLLQQSSALYQAWFEDYILYDGSIPSKWRQGTLADIANVTSGKRPPVKSAEKTDTAVIPLVGAASVMGYTTEANHTDKILVTGRVGTHGVIQRFNSPCWTSDNTLVITSDFYEYTYQILQRIDYNSMNRGSTQPLITQGDMNKVSILIPDQETLHDFETLVGQLMEQYQANILENNKLAEIRDTLLPKLMSGKLDVSELDL